MLFSKSETVKAKVVESTLNLTYQVSVRRSSRRRSIELRVTGSSEVRILCPLEISDTQIVDFVRSKADWIESKLLLNQTRAAIASPDYESGSIWQLRGQRFVPRGFVAAEPLFNGGLRSEVVCAPQWHRLCSRWRSFTIGN